MLSDLQNIHLKRSAKRRRLSSYDPTGGNDDFIVIQPGQSVTFAQLEGPGIITHLWCTLGNDDPRSTTGGIGHEEFNVRKVVFTAYWDDESDPSIQAPLGDFFGMGHGITRPFVSEPFQMSPEDGHGFNCWFPMPFRKSARLCVTSECKNPMRLYFYVDYETGNELPPEALYYHAQWRRECPTDGVEPAEKGGHGPWTFGGPQDKNLSGRDNYVILEAQGAGHYVGCNLNIHNLNMSMQWDWFGEGDDMIFIDGEERPSILGTGMEDYFNCAWSPTQTQQSPWHGVILAGDGKFKGKHSYYRYHVRDPIYFEKSIKVTIEHGHNNHRSDDYSSTAYWYQTEPHLPQGPIAPVEQRLPVDEHHFWWKNELRLADNTDRVETPK